MDVALESDVVVHAALEHSPRGAELDGDLLDRLLPALSRARARPRPSSTRPGSGCIGPAPDPADESVPVAPTPHAAWRAAARADACSRRRRSACARSVVRPGIVYGGKRGIVSDLLKDALERARAGHRARQEPLAVRLRPRPRGALRTHRRDARSLGRLPRQRRGRRAGQRHRRGHRRPRFTQARYPARAARRRRGPSWDPTPTPWRSISVSASPRARAIGWAPTLRSVSGNVARLLEEYRNAR